ncbi:META domain-containing protein [Corynebacterium macginleyi]|uniref:META domain-containing protein n=1 Tax=Corynebacterium macginleyi TaxID=38290 RepID=UPI0019092491|nr:META domain-containing protein [Corynebacterium macginleyi]MBK4160117.1 META domain-containing protein [Corynebacterium macginleyi]
MSLKKIATATMSVSAAALMGMGVAHAVESSIDSEPATRPAPVEAVIEIPDAPAKSDLVEPLPAGADKLVPNIEGQTITAELHSVKENGKFTVEFGKDQSLVLEDSCNVYTTSYHVDKEGTIRVGDFVSTLAACDEDTQAASDSLRDVLKAAPAFYALPDGQAALGAEDNAVVFNVVK